MCRPLSGYAAIINDDVKLWSSENTDSHSEIATEFNLRDNGKHKLFAFEFYPNYERPSADTSTWTLAWDSDATNASRKGPGKEDEARFRAEIEKAAKKYV